MALHRRFAVIAFILAGFIFPEKLGAYEIQGKILLSAPFPEVKKVAVKKKPNEKFPGELPSSSLLFSADGGLQNAVIALKGEFPDAPVPAATTVLDQHNYQFEPHILVLEPGQTLKIGNGDPMAHDVRVFDGAKMLYQFGMDPFQNPVENELAKPGIYTIRCGLHSWMHAFVVKTAHPYVAVSDEKGEFKISGIPAGKHLLHVWHETLGEGEISAEVSGANPAAEVVYTFKNP